MTFSDPISAPGPVPARTEEPTLGALVHDLSRQIPDLIRSELRLAQAEVAEKGKRAGLGIGMFSAAGLLAFFGVAGLLTTAILALDLVHAHLAGSVAGDARRPRGGRRRRPRWQEAGRAGRSPGTGTRGRRGQGRHRHDQGATNMSDTNMSDTHLTPDELEAQIEVAARAPRRHRRPARPQAGREGPGEGEAGLDTQTGSAPRPSSASSAPQSWRAAWCGGGDADDAPRPEHPEPEPRARAPRASTAPSPPRPTRRTRASPTIRRTSRSGPGGTSPARCGASSATTSAPTSPPP